MEIGGDPEEPINPIEDRAAVSVDLVEVADQDLFAREVLVEMRQPSMIEPGLEVGHPRRAMERILEPGPRCSEP